MVESQQSHMEELEAAAERLREEMRRKEEEFEEKLLQARQQQTSTLRFFSSCVVLPQPEQADLNTACFLPRSQVNSNTSMIRLQKQLADRSNSVTELEGRYRLLQEVRSLIRWS